MKKKVAQDAEDTPLNAWKFFVAFGIVLLMVVGIVAYRNYEARKTLQENQYNGFDFQQTTGGLWVTRIEVGQQPYDIPFYYHPRETLTVGVHRDAPNPLLRGAPSEVYIAVDPDAGAKVVIAGVEIARITGSKYNLLNLETRSALTRPAAERVDIPIVNCQHATADRVVIQFEQGRQNAVMREGNCIRLVYTDANESVRVADRYAYMLLQIMH